MRFENPGEGNRTGKRTKRVGQRSPGTEVVQLEGRTFLLGTPATGAGLLTGMSLADGTAFNYAATAYEQNGNVISPAPAFVWSVMLAGPGGTVTGTGRYTAPATGAGTAGIRVTAGGVTGTTMVNVTAAGVLTGDIDVGSPKVAGHYSFDGTTYAVTGGGSDIWNASDQFNFADVPLAGDGVVEARVTAVGNTDPWAKAGVMFRAATAGTSQDVYLVETPAGVVQLLDRTATGVAATTVGQTTVGQTGAGTATPTWLKLVREGNRFAGLWSPDGTSWNQLGSAVTVGLNASVLVGLVASSHDVGVAGTSTFDDVQVMAQPTTGVYRLATRGLAADSLDVYGFGNADETPVQVWGANHTDNQQWLVQAQGNGTYKIYAYSGENSLQMLDLTNGTTANGTMVNTYEDNGNPAQLWLFVPVAGGGYRIVPKNGENTLQTLELQNGNGAARGARTEVWSYWGGNNQVFTLADPGAIQVLPSPKKGLAGNPGESAAVHNAWAYDWGSNGAGNVPSTVEYDPMVWGYYGNANNGFANWMSGIKATGAKYVIGLNEPDNAGQADSTVANALEALGYMQKAGLPLVSPARVDAGDAWMQSFMAGAAADGYRVDAVAINWYGGDDPAGFINYVNYIHTLYNKPIWITEFCPADWSGNGGVSVADATRFMRAVVPQLNAMSFVQRYSWFSATPGDRDLGQGALFNLDGSLTTLGSLYSRL